MPRKLSRNSIEGARMTFHTSQRGALKSPGGLLVDAPIYRRLEVTLMRRSATQAVATPVDEPALASATVRKEAGISVASIDCTGRISLMLTLMAAFLAASSSSW